jgi:hypothetical protein
LSRNNCPGKYPYLPALQWPSGRKIRSNGRGEAENVKENGRRMNVKENRKD